MMNMKITFTLTANTESSPSITSAFSLTYNPEYTSMVAGWPSSLSSASRFGRFASQFGFYTKDNQCDEVSDIGFEDWDGEF